MVGIGIGQSLEKNLRKIDGLREKGQLDRALKQLQDWARKHPDTPHYQYEAAMVAFELSDWGTGVNALRGLLRAFPDTREKILGACRERFADNAALALGEFLVEQDLASESYALAEEHLNALSRDDRAVYRRKQSMRHQSLLATGGGPSPALSTSHVLQFLLACACGDGAAAATEVEALVAGDEAPPTAFETVVARSVDEHGASAGFALARARLRHRAGALAEAAGLAHRAAQLEPNYLETARALTDTRDPGDETRGRWLLARGDLAILANEGDAAARLYLESADADPDLRDALLERLDRWSRDPAIRERGELLKLQLRLLVVQKRFDEIPPLSQALLKDGFATAQEMRALLGEGRSEGLPNEMLVVMAETALRDGDLPAAATHAHEIPPSDHTALNRLLRTVEALLPGWEDDSLLQLEALHAVLLSRIKNHENANERLASMWRDHRDAIDVLLPVTERCLETVDAQPVLVAAALAVLLDAGQEDHFAPTVAQVLHAGVGTDVGPGNTTFDQDNLNLDFGSAPGEDVSHDLGSALVHVLDENPDRAPRLLALLDALDPALGAPHRLRHALALAALYAKDYDRALPALTIVVMMAEPDFVKSVGAQVDRAIEADPGRAELHAHRAELHADVGEVEDASEHLSLALSADPSRADELTDRFESLIGKADVEEAPALWRSFAESLFAAGRFDQLADVCRQALESLPPDRAAPFLELQARTMIEEGHLSEALQFVQSNMVAGRIANEQAIGVLEDVLRAQPASSIGHLMLGQAASRANDMDRAIDGYLGAVRLDPSLAAPVGEQIHKIASRPGTQGNHLIRVAEFQLGRGDHAGAADLLEKALHMDVDLADRVLGELRDHPEAADASPELLAVAAHAARLAGDVERACEGLLRLDAKDPGRFEIVLTAFRKLRDDFPDRLLPVLCMARVLIHHQAPEAAAQTVVDAAADDAYPLADRIDMLADFHDKQPRVAAVALALAARLGERGDLDAAVDHLREAGDRADFDADRAVEVTRSMLDRTPEHAGLRLVAHDFMVRAGSIDDALRWLPDPSALGDDDVTAICERMEAYRARVIASPALASTYARALRAQQRHEDALEILRAACERTGARSSHPLWTELAAALHEGGDVDESGRILLEQSRTDDDRREAHQLFADWTTRRVESERRALAARHAESPHDPDVALRYAACLLDAGRPDDVPGILGGAAFPAAWKVRRAVLLGRAYLETNRADRAEIVMEAAARVASDDEDGRTLFLQLSECHERLGRPAAATAHLTRLLGEPAEHDGASRRVRRTYGQYLEDVAGTRRAVLTRLSSL